MVCLLYHRPSWDLDVYVALCIQATHRVTLDAIRGVWNARTHRHNANWVLLFLLYKRKAWISVMSWKFPIGSPFAVSSQAVSAALLSSSPFLWAVGLLPCIFKFLRLEAGLLARPSFQF